jgi:cell division protein FtsW (lipid II flippase)
VRPACSSLAYAGGTGMSLLAAGVSRRERATPRLLLLVLAAAFVFVNAVMLSLALEGAVTLSHLWAPGVWLLLVGLAHWILERCCPHRDPLLLPIYALLTGWGLILIDRLAPNFLGRQVLWLLLGTAALVAAAVLPGSLRLMRRYRYSWLTLGLVLLLATLFFGVNPSGAGATLWLHLPFVRDVYFQPSELLKLLLLIFLASYFDQHEQLAHLRTGNNRRAHLAYLGPLLLMWGFCITVLMWQRDLGTATLFFVTFLVLLYLATGRWLYVGGGFLLLLGAGILGYFTFSVVELRIDTWWNPWPEATDRAFQIVQSLYAIAAGGIFGQGVGQGFPIYIPVVHSDFAFAAIAEEWGLVGSLTTIALFALITERGLRLIGRGRRPFYNYLAAGIAVMLGLQAFLIIAGVSKLLPLTGVTLPFVSYGGSSLLMSSLMIGLLIHLSTRVQRAAPVVPAPVRDE